MARFRFVLLILVLWLIILFNIERPEVGGVGIEISSLVYVLASLITFVVITLPDLSQANFLRVFIPIVTIYALGKLIVGYSVNPSIFFYVTISEIVILFVTTVVARLTSHTFLNMEIAVEDAVLEKDSLRTLTMDQGEEVIGVELFRGRRYGHTVAIIHLGLNWLPEMQPNADERFDFRHVLKRRYIQGQVAQHTQDILFRGDITAWHNGNLVICLPGSSFEAAQKNARELHEHLAKQLGIDLHMGISLFPVDGLIYDDLVNIAIDTMRSYSTNKILDSSLNPPFLDTDATGRLGRTGSLSGEAAAYQPPFVQSLIQATQNMLTSPEVITLNYDEILPRPATVNDPSAWVDELPSQSGSSKAIYRQIKRLMDIGLVLLAMPLILPLLIVVVVLVYLDSGSPIFFSQTRTGLGGRRFKMYKFRTMVPDAEALLKDLAVQGLAKVDSRGKLLEPLKMERDPRVTRMGRILRKTSLDEIPQLFNVLRGDMSLVGPRPTSWDLQNYNMFQTERLNVRPGITGLWQVYSRGNTDFDIWLQWDVKYVDKMSLYLDIRLLIATVMRVLVKRQKGAR